MRDTPQIEDSTEQRNAEDLNDLTLKGFRQASLERESLGELKKDFKLLQTRYSFHQHHLTPTYMLTSTQVIKVFLFKLHL